jgi:hypothetical protein
MEMFASWLLSALVNLVMYDCAGDCLGPLAWRSVASWNGRYVDDLVPTMLQLFFEPK